MKKLISGLLSVLLLASAVVCAIPMTAGAASSTYTSVRKTKTLDETKAIVNSVQNYRYDTAEEALLYESSVDEATGKENYLVSYTQGNYSLYINVYTGAVYYKNNATGQILTSNPVNFHGMNDTIDASYESGTIANLMSQISVSLFDITSSSSYSYNTYEHAALLGQISTQEIQGGIRVNYTIGDTTTRFLYPGLITYETFMKKILEPMLNSYRDMLLEYKTQILEKFPHADFDFLDGETFTAPNGSEVDAYEYGCISIENLKNSYLSKTGTLGQYLPIIQAVSEEDYNKANALGLFISKLVSNGYSLQNPAKYSIAGYEGMLSKMNKDYPVTKDGTAVFAAQKKLASEMRSYSNGIKKYAPEFTYALMFDEEEKCGYEYESLTPPVLRCSIEYRLGEDGALTVSVPANSISFDSTVFTLKSFDVLPYFGAGNMTDKDGYVFYPDGCGTIVSFKDFFTDAQKPIINLSSVVFGNDFSYASVTGKHREQVTMPVFGVVNTVTAGASSKAVVSGIEKVTNGYFAILEEGSSLATLRLTSGGGEHRFMNVSTSYTPYPTDTVNLSESIGGGSSTGSGSSSSTTTDSSSNSTVSLGNYTITGKVPYGGNYTIRYTMLCDPTIATANPTLAGTSYKANYNDMAKCYRDYLKADGTLTAIEKVSDNLPLYLEVIGAMEIDDTFLTFPIRKKIALTTFDDVLTMYNDFAKEGVTNINFKMTGFANGGIESTYPVRNKMERVLGGLSAFKKLVKSAKSISSEEGKNLGLYPEYDFLYINNAELFDGVGLKNNVSRMLDNRYAVKRVYNSVSQEFEMSSSSVIAAEALDKLYSRFAKKFDRTGAEGISVSTLGSDLSSNMDEKETVDREEERQNVMSLLDRMANTDNYSLMIDTGNIYAVKYAAHILNAETDSSHFRYSSYAVPFVGMVLHSYVNYAGSPLNNSGSPEYEILRDIESGASLYYTLCYEHDNIAYMKQETATNPYYSVDYQNWFNTILENYEELNGAIGDLQDYVINGHTVIKGERVVSESERQNFYLLLTEDFKNRISTQLAEAIDAKIKTLAPGETLDVTVDTAKLYDAFYAYMKLSRYETDNENYELDAAFKATLIGDFNAFLADLKSKTEASYVGNVDMTFDSVKVGKDLLAEAFMTAVETQFNAYVATEQAKIKDPTKVLRVFVDTDAMMTFFASFMRMAGYDLDDNSLDATFKAEIKARVAAELATFKADREALYAAGNFDITFKTFTVQEDQLPYDSYLTDSSALDGHNYVGTEYTCDNGNIVLVTYENEKTGKTVQFILNYNIFSVVVKLNGETYNLDKYSYVRIDVEGRT